MTGSSVLVNNGQFTSGNEHTPVIILTNPGCKAAELETHVGTEQLTKRVSPVVLAAIPLGLENVALNAGPSILEYPLDTPAITWDWPEATEIL